MTNLNQQLKGLIQRHKEQFIKAVSYYYPFTPDQVEAYSAVLDFNALSHNQNCHWDIQRVKKFKSKLDFECFQGYSKFWSDTAMIDYFLYHSPQSAIYVNHTKKLYQSLETNLFVPWSFQLIEKYDHMLNFGLLSHNHQIPWTIELLEKYFSRLSWIDLSLNRGVPFADEMIEHFYSSWDWGYISMNQSIPWTLPLFDKYKSDLQLNIAQSSGYSYEVITGNYDIVTAYPDLFDWSVICSNQKLPWIEKDLLKRWHHKLNWYGLAGNEILFRNDPDFFEKNRNKWEECEDVFYDQFSGNSALAWSEAFIEEYIDEWDWTKLAANTGLPWSTEFLDKYVERFVEPPLTDGFVEVVPGGLQVYHKVPWTLSWIIRYEKYINFKALLDNRNIWNKLINPVMDDETMRYALE